MTLRIPSLVLCAILLAGCATPSSTPTASPAGFHAAFAHRVARSEARLPALIASAETAARRNAAHTNLLINVPYFPQQTFAEEILNRSGGLANALPTEERAAQASSNDIVLFAVTDWETDGTRVVPLLNTYRSNGWHVVLFASAAGAPAGAKADDWIDNGAAGGWADESDLNALVNVLNGWLWCLEYTSAMTRHGWYPGILQGILEVGADAHNENLYKTGRPTLYPMQTPIAAGRLARAYLKSVQDVLDETGDAATRGEIDKAAALLADRLDKGGTVLVSTCTHFLLAEIHRPSRSPWKPVNAVWQTQNGVFEKNAGPGDFVVWFGYAGLSTKYEDYGGAIRKSGARLVASYTPDTFNPSNNAREAEVVIGQSWALPDAVVPVPFAPGHMAPVSGIESGLIYRMLDEAVDGRLKPSSTRPSPSSSQPRP